MLRKQAAPMQVEPEHRGVPASGRRARSSRRVAREAQTLVSPRETSMASMPRRHRGDPHGITGTVEIAFCGDPSISRSLTAR
jgi:hypothetical protein